MASSGNKYAITFSGARIEATVTDRAAAVNQWVREIISANHGCAMIVGLDCEWRPNTSAYDNNRTATLQLCVDTKCLIVQLFYLDYIPLSLQDFFNSSNVTFVGVEVQDDLSKLKREYGLEARAAAEDIQATAMELYPVRFYRKPGLKKLASSLLGLVMAKPIHVCRSDWQSRVLSLDQIEYACIDAYASYRIGRMLESVADVN